MEKVIRFNKRFAPQILQGIKDQTRRPVLPSNEHCPYGTMGSYMIWKYSPGKSKPQTVVRLAVVESHVEPLKSISEADLVREGGFTREAFFKTWDEFYPTKYHSSRNPDVWVVTFKREKVQTW